MLDWQTVISLLIVVAAAIVVALRLRSMIAGKVSSCGSCSNCPGKSGQMGLVQIGSEVDARR